MFVFFIAIINTVLHFIYFGHPPSVVFDEVFYGNFVSNYWQGTYFFDLHPPFAKLLFASVGWIFGANHFSADWATIGNALPSAIVNLRLVPMIAGILLPLAVYALCRRFDMSKISSFLAASLISLENSLIVQSRFLLPDIIMHVCGFSAIFFYLEYRRRSGDKLAKWFLAGSLILAALALSIKWTGLTYLFLIVCLEIYRLMQIRKIENRKVSWLFKWSATFMGSYAGIALLVYGALFAFHFSLLPRSGPGDVFMTLSFQKSLDNNPNMQNPDLKKEGFVSKFLELNHVMYAVNRDMTATHPYSSKWYTWPIMTRTIFYWQSANDAPGQPHSYIYLLGNPLVYWLSTFSIAITLLFAFWVFILRKAKGLEFNKRKLLLFLSLGYLVNFLPFIFIGRVMFLYHYEAALLMSIISVAFLADFFGPTTKKILTYSVLVFALVAFIYWSPLTYGLPMSDAGLASRMWLSSWR